jgi:hypothetical protein
MWNHHIRAWPHAMIMDVHVLMTGYMLVLAFHLLPPSLATQAQHAITFQYVHHVSSMFSAEVLQLSIC